MNYQIKTKKQNTGKWPFWAGATFLLLFMVTYLFCARGLVISAVKSRDLRAEADKISPRVSELEAEYVALQNEITLEKAYALGFRDTATEFITSNALGKGVSMRNEIQ